MSEIENDEKEKPRLLKEIRALKREIQELKESRPEEISRATKSLDDRIAALTARLEKLEQGALDDDWGF